MYMFVTKSLVRKFNKPSQISVRPLFGHLNVRQEFFSWNIHCGRACMYIFMYYCAHSLSTNQYDFHWVLWSSSNVFQNEKIIYCFIGQKTLLTRYQASQVKLVHAISSLLSICLHTLIKSEYVNTDCEIFYNFRVFTVCIHMHLIFSTFYTGA